MNRTAFIAVKDPQESAQEFIEAWHTAEKGQVPEKSRSKLYFEDMETLLRTLSPKRLLLLKKLHHEGASSIRSLAKKANRDYKNVYNDVKALGKAGLVLKEVNGRFSAPWSAIVTKFDL
ncbi:MAG: hypothetical protein HQL56_19030 [Magnetococcales bacterium]|nr:hypothetical protein [Magnetococcales bacterium]